MQPSAEPGLAIGPAIPGSTTQAEKQRLESELARAGDSPIRLAKLFASMNARLGLSTASQLWWGAFGARDAAET